MGLLYGIVFLSHQIGSFFGAYLGGLFHDLYGSYDYAWYLAIALSVFAALIHLPIKEQPVSRLTKNKLKTNNILKEINTSGKPYVIYKTSKGFDLFTNFSKKIILIKRNIINFLKKNNSNKKKLKKTDYL